MVSYKQKAFREAGEMEEMHVSQDKVVWGS